jgi:hypothetical protein
MPRAQALCNTAAFLGVKVLASQISKKMCQGLVPRVPWIVGYGPII